MTKLLLSFFLFFLSLFINAQERISADRPDQTEGATLTPYHYFQAEFGFSMEHLDKEDYNISHPGMLLKYSVCKKFELQLLGTFASDYEKMITGTKRTTGVETITVGFRTALWEEKKILPKTSIIVRFGIPVIASKSFRANHFAPSALLAMENTITEKIGLSYNLGVGWDGFSSTPSWLYSLSSGFDIGKKWDAFFELFGSTMKDEMAQNGIDTGLGFYVSNNIKLDAYIGIGITEAASNNLFGAGISFRFH